MLSRIGLILIISGFLLLYQPELFSIEMIVHILNSSIQYWPIFLIVIGFIFVMPKKKRKTHR